ncbi:MAG: MptD family putative ECF transporter S component [Lachnospiraceae bacterium]|nr:MptD family putative ECF transporter S component [Lachnospiraceae bacterium]
MKERNEKGFSVRDLITIGIFGVLLLLCAMLTGGPFAAVPTLTFYYPIGAALLAGPVFMLFLAKVPKLGGLMIVGAVLCFLGTVTGMHWGMNIGYLICSCIAALFAGLKKFRNMGWNVLAYIIYSIGPMGTYIVFFFNRESWIGFMLKKGTEQEYIDQMSAVATVQTMIVMVVGTLIVALLSGMLGVKLMKKQFVKAGIAA